MTEQDVTFYLRAQFDQVGNSVAQTLLARVGDLADVQEAKIGI